MTLAWYRLGNEGIFRLITVTLILFLFMLTAPVFFNQSSTQAKSFGASPLQQSGFSTLLVGTGNVEARAVSFNNGTFLVAGRTNSATLPNVSLPQVSTAGGQDGFLSRLDQSGNVVWSTFLGGNGADVINGLFVASNGWVYLTGSTRSTNFPMTGVQPPALQGASDAFLTVVDPVTGTLVFSTIFGTAGDDSGNAILVGADGQIFIAGERSSAANKIGSLTVFPALGTTSSTQSLDLEGPAYAIATTSKGNLFVTGQSASGSGFASYISPGLPNTNPILNFSFGLPGIGYCAAVDSNNRVWIGYSLKPLDSFQARFIPLDGDESGGVMGGEDPGIGRFLPSNQETATSAVTPQITLTTTPLPNPVRSLILDGNGVLVAGPQGTTGYVTRVDSSGSVTNLIPNLQGVGQGVTRAGNGFATVGTKIGGNGYLETFVQFNP